MLLQLMPRIIGKLAINLQRNILSNPIAVHSFAS
jgi:hypothetical protein